MDRGPLPSVEHLVLVLSAGLPYLAGLRLQPLVELVEE